MDSEDELSEEMVGKLDTFEESLNNLETTLKPFLRIPVNDTNEKIDDPLLKARLDLMVAYSINSLFWGYLCTQGINAKNHPIRNELKRVQDYMSKVKLSEEKKKMARVDTHAAKRFIRNALWEKPECSNQGYDTKNDSDELETDRVAETSKNYDSDEPERDVPAKKVKLDNEQNGGDDVVPKKKKKKKNKKSNVELETDRVAETLSKNDDIDEPEKDVPAKKVKLDNEQNGEDEVVPKKKKKKKNKKSNELETDRAAETLSKNDDEPEKDVHAKNVKLDNEQNGEDEVLPKKSKKKKNKKSGNDEKRKKKKKKEHQQDD